MMKNKFLTVLLLAMLFVPFTALTDTTTDGDLASDGGDLSGPASSDDEGVPRFDGATGKLLQDSKWKISDTGAFLCKIDADCSIGAVGANRPLDFTGSGKARFGTSAIMSAITLPGVYGGNSADVIATVSSDDASGIGGALGFQRSNGDLSFFQSEKISDIGAGENDLDIYYGTAEFTGPVELFKQKLKFGYDGSLTLNPSNAQSQTGGFLRNTLAADFAEQGSAPGTPDSGDVRLYFKADAELYKKDDAGVEVQISGLTIGSIDNHSDVDTTTVAPSTDDFLRWSGSAFVPLKNSLSETTAPGVNNDSSQDYGVGSTWIDVTADKAYRCLDATNAAAVWIETTQAGSGAHDLGGAQHNADTLANLNSKVSDATLIDTADSRLSDARTPTAHALGGAEHSADTLANLNSKVSDATLIDTGDSRLSDARTPTSHAFAGAEHSASTLAAVNGKISDATLIDTGDSRLSDDRNDADAIHDNIASEISAITVKVTPVGADFLLIEDSAAANIKKHILISSLPGGAPSGTAGGDLNGTYPNPSVDDGADATAIHDNVGSEISAITVKGTPIGADFLLIEDSAAANAKKHILISSLPGGAPAAHASDHEDAGSDEIEGDIIAGISTFTPSNYTPSTAETGCTATDQICAQFTGINDRFGMLATELFSDTLQTTDGTTTTIRTVAIADNFVENIDFDCVAIIDDGTKGAGRQIKGTFRNPAGASTVTGIGSVTTIYSKVDTPNGYSTALTISTDDILLEVTGHTAETVEWRCKTEIISRDGTP